MSASVLIRPHLSILRYRPIASLVMLWSCKKGLGLRQHSRLTFSIVKVLFLVSSHWPKVWSWSQDPSSGLGYWF